MNAFLYLWSWLYPFSLTDDRFSKLRPKLWSSRIHSYGKSLHRQLVGKGSTPEDILFEERPYTPGDFASACHMRDRFEPGDRQHEDLLVASDLFDMCGRRYLGYLSQQTANDLDWVHLYYGNVMCLSWLSGTSTTKCSPRLEKLTEFRRSLYIAGSSLIILPFSSYLFRQPQAGHRKKVGSKLWTFDVGPAKERQKKHVTEDGRRKSIDIFRTYPETEL